jgi:3-isopropylmalate/(R)-2-methylmalate dehydratase large subunit
MGAFGAGVGRSEVAALWATGELWLRVPESMRIVLEGTLPTGVTAKDFALRVIGDLSADGGIYVSIELSGSGVAAMSLASRMVLPNMMAETGAKNAYVVPDAAVFDWLAPRLARRTGRAVAECQGQIESGALYPDADARYILERHYDAAALEPYIACPHAVDNVVPLSQVAGTRVQQVFLGTCTNGRLEDIAAAAAVVQGHRVAPGTRFLVIPASSQVLQEAMQAGYLQTLVEAGAVIGVPGCGPCMGNHMGIPAPGEVTISSANRNFQGRMGTREAEIYLANPAVVAAAAVRGVIADPRDL